MNAADELDVVLDDIAFNAVLIESLDVDDDHYQLKLEELQSKKAELETKSAELEARLNQASDHLQHTSSGMGDAGDAGFPDAFMDSPPRNNHNGESSASRNPFSSQSAIPFGATANSMKRPRPQSSHLQPEGQAYKRQTPDISNAPTPTSSDGSYEFVPRESWQDRERDRLFRRQQAAEAEARKRRDQALRDEQFARQLSQQTAYPHGQPSSSRSNVQTTINMNGSFRRPPAAAPPESSQRSSHVPASRYGQPSGQTSGLPQIKTEQFTYPRHQQLATRPRQPTAVVDLTNSDSEDDVAEIGPANFVRNNRQPVPHRVPPPQYQMPGSFPGTPVYGANIQAPGANRQPPGFTVFTNPYRNNTTIVNNVNNVSNASNASNANYASNANNTDVESWRRLQHLQNIVRDGAQNFRSQLQDVGNLIYGSNVTQPWDLVDDDDDDEITYMGARQLAGYAGREDLYRDRYDAMQNYDPAKSKEEIQELLANIRPDEDMPAHLRVQTPEDLTVRLHKYQEVGLTWLKNQEEGSSKGGILADDMGLGKTIQMLSLMVTRRSEDFRCKTTLIVAPVALLRQWKQEIQNRVKAAPQYRLSVFTHHGTSKAKDFDTLRNYDVVLTTYGSIASELKKLENFTLRKKANPNAVPYPSEKLMFLADNAEWYRVILDEAQCIKNRNTQTAKGACLLKAKYRFCVTGTPMMNNVDELYSLIKFLKIKPYCHWEKFRLDFNTPLKNAHDITRDRAMRSFQILCKSIMLRRTKKSKFEGEPILNLPERSTTVDNPVFSEDEQAFYSALETQTQVQFNKYLRRGTVGQQYSAILVLLLRLRQACCHPHLIKDFGVAAAADMTEDQMLTFAKQLDPQVVERIKATEGNFECPVCYDAVANPAIFIPCGHDTCSECFSKIADPVNAIQQGNENGGARCPNCRGSIDAKRLTDFNSFKKVHMPELLTEAERAEVDGEKAEQDDSEDEADDSSSESDEEEDEDDDTLGGFIVNDDEEVESDDDDGDLDRPPKVKKERKDKSVKQEEGEDQTDAVEGVAGPSTTGNGIFGSHAAKSKKSKGKKPKKGKGKAKKKPKKKKIKGPVTLADLKKDSTRSLSAKKKYLKRLRKTYIGSAKIDKTMEILREIMQGEDGEKVLIFSQWTSLLDLLEIPIDEEGFGYRRYDGSMTANMRADAVDDFKDEQQNVRIMLVSLKAGNAGLNLNMASQVIILDPFWNPYIEEQAIDRAHRIGQMRPVTVHRVLIEGTVEDRIIALQEKKRALISEALDEKSAASLARLGVQELAYLFGMTGNPGQQVNYHPVNGRR